MSFCIFTYRTCFTQCYRNDSIFVIIKALLGATLEDYGPKSHNLIGYVDGKNHAYLILLVLLHHLPLRKMVLPLHVSFSIGIFILQKQD